MNFLNTQEVDEGERFRNELATFENDIFGIATKQLVVEMTRGQMAYYKYLKVGAQSYPSDEARGYAILDQLTVHEWILVKELLKRGGAV